MSRGTSGALLTVAESADQAALLAGGGVAIARNGAQVRVPFDTICVHSDLEGAVERLKAIRARLASR